MTGPVPDDPDRTASAAPSAARRDAVPARVGRYEVRERLGAGAFGSVYRGFDPQLNRDVAIKVPKADALTPELLVRFETEARAAAAIHHPNVCPIYDVGAGDDGVPFLVMRYVAGGTLAGVLEKRRTPYPERDAAAVVRKLALGVAAAHGKGVLHRDLKPANVLWDEANQEVLVTDFGLARVAGATQVSRTGQILGTPAYMSPEQARGKPDGVGPLSDVYSLGVILYRLVTGVVPFDGPVMAVLGQLRFDEPRPPSELRPGLDPRIDMLCATAMAKAPADRYPSAEALADALTDFLRAPDRAGGVSNGPDATVAYAPRSRRFRRALLAAGVLVAGGALAAWLTILGRDPTPTGEPPPGPPGPKPGDVYSLRVGGVEMPFCWIPPGSFRMGCEKHPLSPHEWDEHERPVHRVTISRGFWMGQTEVTQAQWKAVMGTDRGSERGPNRPVNSVSWTEAKNYCWVLSEKLPGREKVRLPTEAEWEYAARAGTTTQYHFGDVIDDTKANYNAEFPWNNGPKGWVRGKTTDVRSFPPNGWGLYDIHGNVWEWCQDWFGPYPADDQIDPQMNTSGAFGRILRGGDWGYEAFHCRVAYRHGKPPDDTGPGSGFRVCFNPD